MLYREDCMFQWATLVNQYDPLSLPNFLPVIQLPTYVQHSEVDQTTRCERHLHAQSASRQPCCEARLGLKHSPAKAQESGQIDLSALQQLQHHSCGVSLLEVSLLTALLNTLGGLSLTCPKQAGDATAP